MANDFENLCNGSGLGDDSKDGCYIATAVYGSYDCPQVWTLRRFRDARLRRSPPGRALVRLYYAVSPALVRRFGHIGWLRRVLRTLLDGFVFHLRRQGLAGTPYEDLCRGPSSGGSSFSPRGG
jgi:hypothetical protein